MKDNTPVPVKFVVADINVKMPKYATEGSAGVDLLAHNFKSIYTNDEHGNPTMIQAATDEFITIPPYSRLLVGTGLFVEIPKGTELQIRSRSGKTLKEGLIVGNAPGTIDSDYRGEIGVILINTTDGDITVKKGDAVAQAVLAPYYIIDWQEAQLSETQRGAGGFGSTGK